MKTEPAGVRLCVCAGFRDTLRKGFVEEMREKNSKNINVGSRPLKFISQPGWWLSWLRVIPCTKKAAGSTLGQSTYPGCAFDPLDRRWGSHRRQAMGVSLSQ